MGTPHTAVEEGSTGFCQLCPLPMRHPSHLTPEPAADEVGRTIPSRGSDPRTSHAAAKHVAVTAKNQRGKILAAYAGVAAGLTDDEAQVRAGVSPESCYWKRCSELRDGGYIADTGLRRTGRAGVERIVSALTQEGAQALSKAGLVGAQYAARYEPGGAAS